MLSGSQVTGAGVLNLKFSLGNRCLRYWQGVFVSVIHLSPFALPVPAVHCQTL